MADLEKQDKPDLEVQDIKIEKPVDGKKKHNAAREITEWLVSIIIAVALALVIHNNVFQIIKVEGPSMQQTLWTGERMFVTPFSYMKNQPERGDIVVTNFPNDSRHFVKRVIGLEGDVVEVSEGSVYINGIVLIEEYLFEDIRKQMAPVTVSKDAVFVMGDNRNNSSDSRMPNVGEIDEALIIGKVQGIVFPFSEYEWFEDVVYD